MELNYYTVDAFTAEIFQGTPVLVFPHAAALDENTMAKLAEEFGFPDTVFVTEATSPNAVGTLRYFTKSGETAFEGHATIGAARVLFALEHLRNGETPVHYTVDVKSGPIKVIVDENENTGVTAQFVLSTPTQVDHFIPSTSDIAKILSVDEDSLEWGSFKPLVCLGDRPYFVVPIRHCKDLLRAKYSDSAWIGSGSTSTLPKNILLFSPAADGAKNRFAARLVGTSIAPGEDPPIGSAMPAFATYLVASDTSEKHFIIERGVGRSRLSVINVHLDEVGQHGATVRVGGAVVMTGRGTVALRHNIP